MSFKQIKVCTWASCFRHLVLIREITSNSPYFAANHGDGKSHGWCGGGVREVGVEDAVGEDVENGEKEREWVKVFDYLLKCLKSESIISLINSTSNHSWNYNNLGTSTNNLTFFFHNNKNILICTLQ